MSLDDDTLQQQVVQSRSSVQTAQAQYDILVRGADQAEIAASANAMAQAESTLATTREQTLSGLDVHYNTLSSVVTNTIDPIFFSNTSSEFPDFRHDIDNDAREIALGQERRTVHLALQATRRYDNVDQALETFEQRVATTRDFVGVLEELMVDDPFRRGISDKTKEQWNETLVAVNTSLDQLEAASEGLRGVLGQARTNQASSQFAYIDTVDGADQEDIQQAVASLSQAQASLSQAQIAPA